MASCQAYYSSPTRSSCFATAACPTPSSERPPLPPTLYVQIPALTSYLNVPSLAIISSCCQSYWRRGGPNRPRTSHLAEPLQRCLHCTRHATPVHNPSLPLPPLPFPLHRTRHLPTELRLPLAPLAYVRPEPRAQTFLASEAAAAPSALHRHVGRASYSAEHKLLS